MTPAEYLRARGWERSQLSAASTAFTWADPVSIRRIVGYTAPDAVAIQVQRDIDCDAFVRSYQATVTLERCDAANVAMAKAKADGLDGDAVRVVGERVMAGVGL